MDNQTINNLSVNELLKQKKQLENEKYKCFNYLKECENNLNNLDNIIYNKCEDDVVYLMIRGHTNYREILLNHFVRCYITNTFIRLVS